jgi:pimeloyl-ACP methyl ester carboxylesterase
MKKLITLSVVLVSLVFQSCEKFELSTQADTFFHVKINKALLPVWVKGNTASGKFIIYINGGPGLTSLDIAKADMLGWSNHLERDFALVYYDQRGCGNSQGNFDAKNTLTVSQYVKDLDAIISVLLNKYSNPNIYLMGHSFGSFIGTNYLLTNKLQAKIKGFISVDGAFNFDYDVTWGYRRQFLENIAQEEINKGNNIGHWQGALRWLSDNQNITTSSQKKEWRKFIGDPGGIILPEELAELSLSDYLNIGFNSSYNPIPSYLSRNLEIVNNSLNADAEGINLISSAQYITIPTLLIWGRYDDLIPIEEAQVVFDSLGTPASNKQLISLPNSGHEPFLSVPKLFQETVSDFVSKY